MANLYQKISNLDQIQTELKQDDLFIISRPTNLDTGTYDSYSCTYSKLSADVRTKIVNVLSDYYADIDELGTVNKYSECKANGKRVVQENVISEIKTNIGNSLTGSFLDKSTTSLQTVAGPVTFQNTITIEDDPTDSTDAANKGYVDNVFSEVDTTTFFSKHGLEPLSSFLVVNKEEYDDIAYGQIYLKKSNPIICYIEEDCLLQIQFAGTIQTSYPIGVFVYQDNSGSDNTNYNGIRTTTISQITNGNTSNFSLIHLEHGYSNAKTVRAINLNIKGGTWIALIKGITCSVEKKQITYQGVWKNKNKDQITQHIKTKDYYTSSSGYAYHYEETTYKKGNKTYTKYVKTYETDSNGKKYKLYTTLTKNVNSCVYDTKKATFANSDTITFSRAVN